MTTFPKSPKPRKGGLVLLDLRASGVTTERVLRRDSESLATQPELNSSCQNNGTILTHSLMGGLNVTNSSTQQ